MTQLRPQPTHEDAPLPVEPGHVRARQHYEAMLAELREQQASKLSQVAAP